MNRESRREKFLQVDLYPVTCERLSAGRSNLDVLDAAVRGGAKIIQLREKELATRDLYRMALAFRKITADAGMLLIINDRIDIALAVDADGVHLGQEDLPLSAARRIAPELLIGISTHSREEALQAQSDGADYVNIGPIFPTRTKEGVTRFLGPEAIPGIAAGIEIPFTVMGGIGSANIEKVVAAGARRVAVVTAVTTADDMAGAVASLREAIRSSRAV
ncbi:MAG: thiamine phosphate synthase [Proteobacteria bacterium]|nr:thiamine phosphate synthase [Pseudomonadota bacterium]